MPSEKFPGPTYNRLIDEDEQIVKVNLDKVEWGSRMSAQPKNIKNSMTIKHVKSKG